MAEHGRLIDADALIAEYDRVHVGAPDGARKLMVDAPTIEPERKKGKWEQVNIVYLKETDEDIKESMAIASMFCPVCKRYHTEVYMYGNPTSYTNFCPSCGADMREGEQNAVD